MFVFILIIFLVPYGIVTTALLYPNELVSFFGFFSNKIRLISVTDIMTNVTTSTWSNSFFWMKAGISA